MLDLEAGDNEGACAVGREDEGDRALGWGECESRVVEDVVRIEEDDTGELLGAKAFEQSVAAVAMLLGVIAIDVTTIGERTPRLRSPMVKQW